MFIPDDVKFILDTFKENSYEAFIVGGCVRDSLINRSLNDYDITTNAMPNDTIRLFKKTIPTGIKHGTITVLIDKEPFEVTTYRIDGEYKDNRRPDDVIFVSNIKEDLSRRDFTINAMAYSPYFGFKDFFNGQNDLKNKIIKCVGNPNKRFAEDSLRMLRAIRFASQLNFDIETQTLFAIKSNSALIQNVSYERINIELYKILKSDNASLGIELLYSTDLLKNIYPSLFKNYFDKSYFEKNIIYIDKLNKDIPTRLCYLLSTCFKNISFDEFKKALKKLKCDNKTIDLSFTIFTNSTYLLSNIFANDKDFKIFISKIDKSIIINLFEFTISKLKFENKNVTTIVTLYEKTQKIISSREALNLKDLDLNGSDLINILNIEKGKKIGLILEKLLLLVFENNSLNKKDLLLEKAKIISENL